MDEKATKAITGSGVESASEGIGELALSLMRRLYPICRSITGDGVRETLRIVAEHIPLEIVEVPTGTRVFDWTVPKEWNIKDAYVAGPDGRRVIDFRSSNLHVVSYSTSVRREMELRDLKPFLHTLPDHPDWIPYRTSYYDEAWGFCLSQSQLDDLPDGLYEVVVDSSLEDGSLSYGECFLPGSTMEEVLLYTHTCHPSLCNDNLSGIAVVTLLAAALAGIQTRFSYRIVFGPGTIGSITWLAKNEQRLSRIKHGLVVALVGDEGPVVYKKSRRDSSDIDRMAVNILRHSGYRHEVVDFSPYGYDERQFCSPGINLPVGRLTRSPNGAYPEYHSSADDFTLVTPGQLEVSFNMGLEILMGLERNGVFLNTLPKGEPQLGRRGLYRRTGGHKEVGEKEYALLWVLNLCDGNHTLLDIAERANLAFDAIAGAAADLQECGLLRPLG